MVDAEEFLLDPENLRLLVKFDYEQLFLYLEYAARDFRQASRDLGWVLPGIALASRLCFVCDTSTRSAICACQPNRYGRHRNPD